MCLITLALFVSWKTAELLLFGPFPIIQHYLLVGRSAGHRAFAKWERAINRRTGSTYKKLPHPPSSHIQGRSISHSSRIFMQTERRENETRLPSWHWFIPLTV